jgi:hypothetical protein
VAFEGGMRRGGSSSLWAPSSLGQSARKRVAARTAAAETSDDDVSPSPGRSPGVDGEFSSVAVGPQIFWGAGPTAALENSSLWPHAALDTVRGEFASSFGPVPDTVERTPAPAAQRYRLQSATPPAALTGTECSPSGTTERLQEANRALVERLATQQAVNAKLERRCEVASSDAASHLRSLVELEEESRDFDVAHATLAGRCEQQERQLKEAETEADDLRRSAEVAENELRGQLAEARSRLSEADALTRRTEQRANGLERDLNHARHDAVRAADTSAAELERVRHALARAENTANDVADENRREMDRRKAVVESLHSEIDLLREAKDVALRDARTALIKAETAADEAAAAVRSKLAAVAETRAEGEALLGAQMQLHEQELVSREEEWAEARQIFERARDAAAAGRENVKSQERLVKAADRLRKQLAAAEREKEALLKAAVQRDVDYQNRAAEAVDTSTQSSEQVAEMRLLVQVAEVDKFDATAAALRLQGELEAVQRQAIGERLALQAVIDKEKHEVQLARDAMDTELRETVAALRRQEKEERNVVEAELALVKAKAFGNEQKLAEAQWALERKQAEVVEAMAHAQRKISEAEAAKASWFDEQQEAVAVTVAAVEVQTDRVVSPDAGVQTDTQTFTSLQDLQAAGTGLSGVVENVPVQFVGGSGSPVLAGRIPGLGSPGQQERTLSRGTPAEADQDVDENMRLADRAARVLAEGELKDVQDELAATEQDADDLRQELAARNESQTQLLQAQMEARISAQVEQRLHALRSPPLFHMVKTGESNLLVENEALSAEVMSLQSDAARLADAR